MQSVASPLEAWATFYVIVGSSAGALTGLQFVVMTLIVQSGPSRSRGESISAFGTPNVVHFCAALLVSAILSIPWNALRYAGLSVVMCGIAGVIYSIIVIRRAHRQSAYTPVFEDWLFHTILPTLSYSVLLVAGAILARDSADALLTIGAALLMLVFVGIHNAWDTVTYVTVQGVGGMREAAAAAETRADAARGAGAGASAGGGAAGGGMSGSQKEGL